MNTTKPIKKAIGRKGSTAKIARKASSAHQSKSKRSFPDLARFRASLKSNASKSATIEDLRAMDRF